MLQGKTKESPADTKHRLADKSVADVCEALIGASLLSGGPNHKFDTAAKAVSAFVDDKAHTVTSWSGYYDMYKTPAYQVGNVDASMKEVARQVGEETGYHFKYPRLLYSAFTHPSYPEIHAKVPCYQRLEFLGDSLFDMVCVNFLYANHPDKDPQWLTEHKMAMVSNKFLSFISVRLGFNKHLQLFNPHPWGRINSYIDDLKRVIEETEDAPDAFIFMKDPPKALADIVEAFVGAIFVDSGFKYEVVEDFFEKFIRRHFENMSYYDEYASSHPVVSFHPIPVSMSCPTNLFIIRPTCIDVLIMILDATIIAYYLALLTNWTLPNQRCFLLSLSITTVSQKELPLLHDMQVQKQAKKP